ncbi:MAG: hypothetical protein NTU78_13365 [Alphaproteobacteria bacterium]|nr:hypothetical protein [Alphaproteobacteria bacterium]
MLVETLHGLLRGLLLVPRVGEEVAGRIGWPIGLVIVLGISLALAPWMAIRDTSALLRLGGLWAVLTLIFEVTIGLLRGLDLPRLLAESNPLAGGLAIYSLAIMFLAPLLAARLRGLT